MIELKANKKKQLIYIGIMTVMIGGTILIVILNLKSAPSAPDYSTMPADITAGAETAGLIVDSSSSGAIPENQVDQGGLADNIGTETVSQNPKFTPLRESTLEDMNFSIGNREPFKPFE